MFKFPMLFISMALIIAGCAKQDKDYHEYLNTGDWAKALVIIQPLAEKGDAEAQYRLGHMYHFGHGVKKDYQKSVELMEKAARLGHGEAAYDLGKWYAEGQGVSKDDIRANQYFARAAQCGSNNGKFIIAFYILAGDGYPQDYKKAGKLFKELAETGYPKAFIFLANIYGSGQGLDRSFILSYKWAYLAGKYNSLGIERQRLQEIDSILPAPIKWIGVGLAEIQESWWSIQSAFHETMGKFLR